MGTQMPCALPARSDAGCRTDYGALIQPDRVHGSLYTSEAVFREELERIYYGGWVFVGHESEIPAPGDYVTRMIGLEPVIMARNKQGEVRVLSNRCTHRGTQLCPKSRGSAKVLTCDYHGWTFSLDGDLMGVPYPGGFTKDKAGFGLSRPAGVDSYRGFVFATFNPSAVTLDEHLGQGKALIDRAVSMSPEGKVRLSAGWVKHRFDANWKMLPESGTDGYHPNFAHSSFLKVFRSQYDVVSSAEDKRLSRTRDWGGGHVAIDASMIYSKPLEWLGVGEERVPEYVQAMIAAYGEEKARTLMVGGPPHSVIFPNLFIAEMNIVIFQPLGPDASVQWHTPMLLEGVADAFNSRLLRQTEAAMGPSAFLLADDSVMAERQQHALGGLDSWMDLSRGMDREVRADGAITGHISDEVPHRGFWSHYKTVMERP